MGNYWTVNGPRVPWDRDGSVLNTWNTGNSITRQAQAVMNGLNSEAGTNTNSNQWSITGNFNQGIAVLLPFARDITALFGMVGDTTNQATYQWQLSQDTTNGVDGTWVALSTLINPPFLKPYYRTSAYVTQPTVGPTTQNIRGVRLWSTTGASFNGSLKAMHIYGEASSSATTQRIAVWHPTLDQPMPGSFLDWSDIQRSSTADISFRVKNLSSTATANNISLQCEVPTDTSPTVLSQFTIGDGSTFASSKTITSLSPNTISSVYTLRRTTGSTAALSVWTGRLDATVSSWT